jgi:hypothetical protein
MTFFFDIVMAPGQIDRHDHRQHLGGQPHRHGDCKQQSLEPIALAQAVDQEHERRQDRNEADHHPGDPDDALVEARQDALPADRAGNLAKSRFGASEHDDSAADAADDDAAHEADVRQIERRLRAAGISLRILLDRHRLAGERRLVDEEIVR